MTRKYPNGASGWDWFDSIDEKVLAYNRLATNPELVSLVEARTRKSIGRVPDVPLFCGRHETGFSVSAHIKAGSIGLLYAKAKDTEGTCVDPIMHVDDAAPDLSITCPVCQVTTKRNYVWVLQAVLASLAAAGTRRPTINVRT